MKKKLQNDPFALRVQIDKAPKYTGESQELVINLTDALTRGPHLRIKIGPSFNRDWQSLVNHLTASHMVGDLLVRNYHSWHVN